MRQSLVEIGLKVENQIEALKKKKNATYLLHKHRCVRSC